MGLVADFVKSLFNGTEEEQNLVPDTRQPSHHEARKMVLREALADGVMPSYDEYAFRSLGSSKSDALPDIFVSQVLRDSGYLYRTHGIARMIVNRFVSIIVEGGIDYQLEFASGFPKEDEKQIRKVVRRFWEDRKNNVQVRFENFVREVLIKGEAGFLLNVLNANGQIRIGDVYRRNVSSFSVCEDDASTWKSIKTKSDKNVETELTVVHECMEGARAGYLVGNVVYFRAFATSDDTRGTPILQPVIDELKAEKKFRILASDRTISRMSLYMDTTLQDATDEEVDEFVATHGTKLPVSGYRFVHSQEVKNEFLPANTEAGDVAEIMRTALTMIAAAFNFPISWFGYGDGSTRATAETQKEPATQQGKNFKTGLLEVASELLTMQIHSAIYANYVRSDSRTAIVAVEEEDSDGAIVNVPMREAVKVKIVTIPLSKEAAKEDPLAATARAVDILSKDAVSAKEGGVRVFNSEKAKELINYALANDGASFVVTEVTQGSAPEEPPLY